MTDAELQEFINRCYAELESKQSLLVENFALNNFSTFGYDDPHEKIQFKNGGIVYVEAKFTPIGTFSPVSETWMWAWGNDEVSEQLKRKSEKLKELASITGFPIFEKAILRADDDMAWELVAMSCHHLESDGIYRAKSDNTLLFMALNDVKTIKSS
ncbi:MAG TPA: hypothetical protein DEP47_09585 [Chloroflexi bacterium]|nr:hypothetical protein [Chloroflexota bacterium]